MSRMVDRAELFNALSNEHTEDTAFKARVFEIIGSMPAVDAEPVVRCRECKWYKNGVINIGEKFCFRNMVAGCRLPTDPEFFCSNGERSELEE